MKRSWAQYHDTEPLIWRALKLAGVGVRRCCEIGAWDGERLSNTRFLLERHGFTGLFVEAVAERVEAGRRNTEHLGDRAVWCQEWVTAENINAILDDAGLLDLLSIDIDGNDWHVWKAIEARPRVVVIEANLALKGPDAITPYDPDFRIAGSSRDNPKGWGASVEAFAALADEKGYQFVARDAGANLIFVEGAL